MGCNASKGTDVVENSTTEQPAETQPEEKVVAESDEAVPASAVEVS